MQRTICHRYQGFGGQPELQGVILTNGSDSDHRSGSLPWAKDPRDRHTSMEETKMDKWECLACGYIYDPSVGDPDSGIEPGTPFEALPDDWLCPDCGVSKDMFEKVE